MNAIDIGVIKAMEEYGGEYEKAFAAAFKLVGENRREAMKEAFIEMWMKYLALSMDMETEETE